MGISVVIPLYNKANEIGRALESVRRQAVAPTEVVVVDDGSTDSSPDVVRQFGLPNLRLVRQANAGECAARNRGIQEAREELIAFLDADDAWEPGFLEAITEMWRKYPGCGIYGTGWRILTANGKVIIPPFRRVPPPGGDGILDSYFASVARGMSIWVSAAASPKSVLEKVGGFPVGVRLAGDRETWLRIAVDYPVAFCNRILATWHLGASNRSSVVYKHDSDHAVIRMGLQLLARQTLSPQLRRDLTGYIARTQVFLAKQLIRLGKPQEARKALFECVAPRKVLLTWLMGMIGSLLPLWLFRLLYTVRCRVLDGISTLRRARDLKPQD